MPTPRVYWEGQVSGTVVTQLDDRDEHLVLGLGIHEYHSSSDHASWSCWPPYCPRHEAWVNALRE
jgi:hypothetical protein